VGRQVTGLVLLALTAIALGTWLVFHIKASIAPADLGTIVYHDAGRFRPEEVLVSHRYGLQGKPDYIVRHPTATFPVEVKSRICGGGSPYRSEKAQLFAYCLLVEEITGEIVRFGVLTYRDREWQVPFGSPERDYVLGVLADMRLARAAGNVARDHTHAARCRGCGFRRQDVCGQALSR
jgi:CRISPR-associated exonuclease Cas4